MAFNAHTYRTNQYRKRAMSELANARDIKARAAVSEAYAWEIDRIPTFVTLARLSWRMYLTNRRIGK